jgi:hypothetical protein
MTSRPAAGAAKLDMRHVRREIRTALELAIVTLAPTKTVDRIAAIAGLLEALAELPADAAPVIALLPQVSSRATEALEEWHKWYAEYLEKRIPRG